MRIFTGTVLASILAIGLLSTASGVVQAQNVYQDYLANRTGTYSPQDPWQKGRVFRTHTGHDGLFYNCDGEEEKRCSPWIRWGQRPCDDLLSPSRIRGEYKQSVCDALERLKMGSCQDHCGTLPGMGYPPGAGYGNETSGSSTHDPSSNSANPNNMEAPPVIDSNIAPPPPVPTSETGQRSRPRTGTSIVDLPSINHLQRVPR